MTRFAVIAGLAAALATLISIGWSSQENSEARPLFSTHTVDDHPHTHDGPFSHGHSHVGLEPGTTHSHPHEHRHQHRSDVALDAAGWFQIGHLHDMDQTAYYVRCTKDEREFHLEFLASGATEPPKSIRPAETFSAEVYIGGKSLAMVKFRFVDQIYVGKTESDKKLNHPALSISLTQVPLGDQLYDFIVPVKLSESNSSNQKLTPKIIGG